MKIILIFALIGAVLYAIDMLICKISPKAGYIVAIFNLPFLPVGIVTFILTQKYLEKTLGVSDVTQYFREGVESTKQKKEKRKVAETQANKRIELVIPEGTTEIKNWEYQNREDIISVVIPEGVVKIGVGAFCECNNLESVVLPYGVDCIMDSAFRDCKKLKTIGNVCSVKEIRETAFSGCDSIDADVQFNVNRIITTSLSWEEMEQRGIDHRWPDKDYDPSYDPYGGPRNWNILG